VLPGVTSILENIGLLTQRWYFFQQARHPQEISCLMVG